MTQQPESTDPIASAGQIDDPDQPTTVHGQDDSRAGRDTQPDEGAADGDPDQRGVTRSSSPVVGGRTLRDGDGATEASAARGTERSERVGHDGKPPKAIQETGVPVVDENAVGAQGAREVDTEALAGTRKFQPRPGDANPNVSSNPQDFPDRNGAASRGQSPEGRLADGPAERAPSRSAEATEHVAGPRGGASDGAVRVTPDASGTGYHRTADAGARQTTGDHTGGPRDGRDTSETERDSTAQYEDPENIPQVEPVRHSRMVEERVQEQERDFDLGTTEDGERYLTPRDTPGV